MKLLQGDCLELMASIPDHSVDMVLADLPFGTTKQEWDKIIDMPLLWSQYQRIVKPNGAIVLFAKPPFDKVLACSNLHDYRYDWIWEKSRATGHLNSSRMPLQAHENICVFYHRQPLYNPQKTTGHKPVNAFYTRKSGACYGDADSVTSGGGSTERHPRSILRYPPVPNKGRLHANQKPVELLENLILTYTNEGDVVLDNTMGSGSTGEACFNTNREFIGIEKTPAIYEKAQRRLTLLSNRTAA
ncbi:site-specific DNA-methyltransferase (plasmid) [Vibrio campbellii]|uniref:Methyltransferase n=1 Tax=Vibrio campbellii TaxID=680 RepID=A0ABY5ILL9_9VIBR|nr:site-specific DNA-methyltransferase [Vibrio campbellii]UTZ35030.1 site-specific DNA-methyltransferase [Vibrio campbellii]UTZ35120.1 site-specific DNA-methyltransferase [Vibrio campbellii]